MESFQEHQYLTFLLGNEVFAANILRITEIIEYSQLTQVPMMPALIRGVINLRGHVVPVIDLQSRFCKRQTTANHRTCIVILEVKSKDGQQDIGVMVDAVNEVIEIAAAEIEPVPNFCVNLRSHFIQGIGKVDGKFVIILDVDRVLSTEEMVVLTEMTEQGMGEEAAHT